MAKRLSERIADRVVKKKPSRNAQNRAAFLALRQDIKEALADGWPVKTIWETLHEEGKVTFGYQAFRGYVNRLILASTDKSEQAGGGGDDRKEKGGESDSQTTDDSSSAVKKSEMKGFVFNPVPNKEDLF